MRTRGDQGKHGCAAPGLNETLDLSSPRFCRGPVVGDCYSGTQVPFLPQTKPTQQKQLFSPHGAPSVPQHRFSPKNRSVSQAREMRAQSRRPPPQHSRRRSHRCRKPMQSAASNWAAALVAPSAAKTAPRPAPVAVRSICRREAAPANRRVKQSKRGPSMAGPSRVHGFGCDDSKRTDRSAAGHRHPIASCLAVKPSNPAPSIRPPCGDACDSDPTVSRGSLAPSTTWPEPPAERRWHLGRQSRPMQHRAARGLGVLGHIGGADPCLT